MCSDPEHQTVNKLVRDKIPEIIESQGRSVAVKTLKDDEVVEFLKRKLNEEVEEFLTSQSLDELADILEVVRALALELGSSASCVEKIREEKFRQNGGFEQRILLLSAETRRSESLQRNSDDGNKRVILK